MEHVGITLSQLNTQIREAIEDRFNEELWIIAEISELNVNSKGHCYVDFIERDELSKKIVARQRATIWAFQFRLLKGYFETTTGQELSQGMKVLVKVRVNFHVLYGFSLNVVDIDPAYTLGEQAKHREEIIRQLEEDGVFEMNKGLDLASIPQNLAIISSESAAGFGDFVNHLELNEYGYAVNWELFNATMQGDQTSKSVVEALANIFDREDEFDAILIIRGGGAKAELTAFDDYDIAFMVTQSPIPVLTGIGHDRDESITDMVAWHAYKTPTAVADFIINQFADFESILDDTARSFFKYVSHFIDNENAVMNELYLKMKSASQLMLNEAGYKLERSISKMQNASMIFIGQKRYYLEETLKSGQTAATRLLLQKEMNLESYQSKVDYLVKRLFIGQYHQLAILSEKALQNDPHKLLKSGYGYITKNGKRIKTVKELQEDDQIKIAFQDGFASAKIEDVKRS